MALLVTCVTANNGFHRSITFLSLHTQRTLTFITSLLRAQWSWRRHDRWHPRTKIHHRFWFCCHSFFSWILLKSFRHCSRANCRTEMASVKQTQKMIPFVTCEIFLGSYVCELVFLVSMYLIWIFGSKLIRSNNQSRATLWVLETCLIVGLLPFMIILITASLSSNTYNKASWWEESTFDETKSTLSKSLITPWDYLRFWIVWGVERTLRLFIDKSLRSIMVLSRVSKNWHDQIP